MNVIIKTKNLELTDSLESLLNKRLIGLKKFIKISKDDNRSDKKDSKVSEIFVEIEKETKHHRKGDIFKAEATIHLPGKSLIANSHGTDLMKLITEVRDELKRELKKHKAKIIGLPRRKYRKVKQELI